MSKEKKISKRWQREKEQKSSQIKREEKMLKK